MGLFDYFRRRRERESAVPSLEITPPSTQVQPLSGETDASQAAQAAGVDLAQLGQIGQMIAEAARSGNIQIQQGDSVEVDGPQTIDLQGSGCAMRSSGSSTSTGSTPTRPHRSRSTRVRCRRCSSRSWTRSRARAST